MSTILYAHYRVSKNPIKDKGVDMILEGIIKSNSKLEILG